jgi:hypothetical protein
LALDHSPSVSPKQPWIHWVNRGTSAIAVSMMPPCACIGMNSHRPATIDARQGSR